MLPAYWNNENLKFIEFKGRYADGEENVRFVKRLVNRIAGESSKPVAVAIVSHSSFLQYWDADEGWETTLISPKRYMFDENGTPHVPRGRVIKSLARGKAAY
ncbi:hypothetical protein ONS95_005887 [Cadophora gregata]|uniref:uncharacterized protein n=1 Tax=Cadophora gregata TaxID=51156 RepID=UPI0026DAFBDD|nr:uncharacterized protein ONS95_005887 [Cadophora gregata]KAK0102265.1 hypothetical protein ONS95_005887 [Cadophora gregata]KAK0103892.1 hypothetical protein ONS96_005000 [Cadophora gregata f. sp. sojae]